MASLLSLDPFSSLSFLFFFFPFPRSGSFSPFRKALLVAPVLAPALHATRPDVLCSWRTAVGSIYSGDHPPPPTWTTTWKEPGDRLAHVAWEARQEKGYSPLSAASRQDLGISTGSMHSWTGRMGLEGLRSGLWGRVGSALMARGEGNRKDRSYGEKCSEWRPNRCD